MRMQASVVVEHQASRKRGTPLHTFLRVSFGLEFIQCLDDLKHQTLGWCAQVEIMLQRYKRDTESLKIAKRCNKVLKRSPKPIEIRHDHSVELALLRICKDR